MINLENDGADPNNPPPDVKNTLNRIESNLKNAKDSFRMNDLLSETGAIKYAYAAATESESLAREYRVTYESQMQPMEVELNIPEWIKDSVGWWVSSETQDSDFINSMQYLIKERIIVLPSTPESSSTGEVTEIPPWIKNTAGWWAQGQVSDKEFVAAMQFLIKEGIIKV